MTTFNDFATSTESSRPIELYKLTVGTLEFLYTSAEDQITIGPDVYMPEPGLSRGVVELGAEADNRTLGIRVPASNAFAQLYVNVVPGERATVSVFRYQRDEVPAFATTVLLFTGLVQSVKFPADAQEAQIAVRSLEGVLGRVVPRITHQGMCGAFLYDEFCGADPTNFNHVGTVSLVSANQITVVGAIASGFDFTGGMVRPTGELDFRTVYAHSGDVLTLLLPFASDVTGALVQVFAGCDHLIAGDCALVFDRVISFVGDPDVPNRNIFKSGIQ